MRWHSRARGPAVRFSAELTSDKFESSTFARRLTKLGCGARETLCVAKDLHHANGTLRVVGAGHAYFGETNPRPGCPVVTAVFFCRRMGRTTTKLGKRRLRTDLNSRERRDQELRFLCGVTFEAWWHAQPRQPRGGASSWRNASSCEVQSPRAFGCAVVSDR